VPWGQPQPPRKSKKVPAWLIVVLLVVGLIVVAGVIYLAVQFLSSGGEGPRYPPPQGTSIVEYREVTAASSQR
jgi:flagellar basal body-associated protein FliL